MTGPLIIGHRSALQVASQGDVGAIVLRAGHQLILGSALGHHVLLTVGLDHLTTNAVLPELCLDHAAPARRVPVALFAPPPSECGVIHVP